VAYAQRSDIHLRRGALPAARDDAHRALSLARKATVTREIVDAVNALARIAFALCSWLDALDWLGEGFRELLLHRPYRTFHGVLDWV
jgi:hypothetical protein